MRKMRTEEDYNRFKLLLIPVDQAFFASETKWGVGRLERLVSSNTLASYQRGWLTYRVALDDGDAEAVELIGPKMIAALAFMDAEATAAGHQPLAPDTWECGMVDGTVLCVVRTSAEASAVIRAEKAMTAVTARPRLGMTVVSEANGMANAGMANAGMANAGMANAGMANAGMANAGMANAGMANAGMTNAGMTTPGMTNAGMTISTETALPPDLAVTIRQQHEGRRLEVWTLAEIARLIEAHGSLVERTPAVGKQWQGTTTYSGRQMEESAGADIARSGYPLAEPLAVPAAGALAF